MAGRYSYSLNVTDWDIPARCLDRRRTGYYVRDQRLRRRLYLALARMRLCAALRDEVARREGRVD